VADALHLPFADDSLDVVICSHVYEHVPEPVQMFREIHRVLCMGGVCYFSAGNRLMWNEPHYNLPLLSVLPRPLAHLYIRLAGWQGQSLSRDSISVTGDSGLLSGTSRASTSSAASSLKTSSNGL
jgi:SAM-dependent methyltransferase